MKEGSESAPRVADSTTKKSGLPNLFRSSSTTFHLDREKVESKAAVFVAPATLNRRVAFKPEPEKDKALAVFLFKLSEKKTNLNYLLYYERAVHLLAL